MKKKLEELDLLDDFLFGKMVSHPIYGERFCKILVTIMLDRDVKIQKVVSQMNFYGQDTDCHGARLDVYLEGDDADPHKNDSSSSIYDIEPNQLGSKADKTSIPRRMRFYHSTIDVRNLQSGADYNQLKNVVIIMITPYDPFDSDRMVYTIRNTCIEDPEMEYDDGALSLFLYTKGTNGIISQELKQLLHYLEDTTWDNAVSDSLKEIQTMVDKVKYEETATVVYLGSFFREQALRNEGIREGHDRGVRECLARCITDFLIYLGTIPEDIMTRINNEQSTDTLDRWLKLAAKAGSIEEFTQGM